MAYILNILESFLGKTHNHSEENKQCSFDCPSCAIDKGTPSGDGRGNLEINYGKNVFKCWSCKDINDMSGSVTKLINRFGNSRILRDYNLFRPQGESDVEVEKYAVELPESYTPIYQEKDKTKFQYRMACEYLHKRRITQDMILEYQIGYTTKGTHFNRIVIPSFNTNLQLNFFVARWFPKKSNKYKYLNPEADKQEIIFNESLINWDATIYLVEGVFDSLPIPNSIPLLGKFLPLNLLLKLQEKAGAGVIIVLDSDAKDDAERLYNELNFGNLFGRIKLCYPPYGHDPASIYEIYGKTGIIKMLRTSNYLGKTNQLQIIKK